MLRGTKLAAAITTTAVALVGPAVVAGPAAAQAAAPDWSGHRTIHVTMTDQGFTLPEEVRAGFVTFSTSTKDAAGHNLQGVQLHKGVSLAKFTAEFRLALSQNPAQAAAGIRAVSRDATAVGGAGVEPSTTVDLTVPLWKGTYYFFDINAFFVPNVTPPMHRLEVDGRFEGRLPAYGAEVEQLNAKSLPRFESPKVIDPGDGILVRNEADEIHEAMFQRLKPGVDNAKLTKFYNALLHRQNPGFNPFAENASRGAGGISPGRIELVKFQVKRGNYALQCFIPDDKLGIPHAFLGMHRVVRLVWSSS